MSLMFAEGFDVARYPRTAAYLAQLPEGFDSFAACEAKATIHRTVYAHANDKLEGLGAVLQAHLDGPMRNRWMPQCHTLALILALVESRRLGPSGEPPWIREAASSLFATPMYKVLMWAASPRLLFRGANIRWSAFFRGSALESQVGEREADLDLVAPPHLFDAALARVFVDVLAAAVKFTEYGSDGATMELAKFEPGRIRYHARW